MRTVMLAAVVSVACGAKEPMPATTASADAMTAEELKIPTTPSIDAGTKTRLELCVADLDEDADPLHADITPAVECLADEGWPALAPLVPLLDAEAEMTRLHALRAVEAIVARYHGFQPAEPGRAPRWPAGAEARLRELWGGVGYDWKAPAEARRAAMTRLEAWMKGRRGLRGHVSVAGVSGGLVPAFAAVLVDGADPALRDCWHAGRGDAELHGGFSAALELPAAGGAPSVKVVEDSVGRGPIRKCLVKTLAELRAPASPSGSTRLVVRVWFEPDTGPEVNE